MVYKTYYINRKDEFMYIFAACRFLLCICSLIASYIVLFDDSIQSLQLNILGWVQLLNYLSGRADDKFCHDRVAIKTKLSVQSKAKLDLNLSAFYQLSSFSSL